ncbi:MAG: hypothetical protein SGPRY_009068 [Prymnesium sp.]
MPHGWGARLADKYARTADVTLRGYSGYNTRWALELLPLLFPPRRSPPALLTLCFGANDAVLPSASPLSRQHVPLDEFAANLRAMLSAVQACPKPAKPPPLPPPEAASACVQAGAQAGVPVIDMCAAFLEQANFPELQPASYGNDALSMLQMDFPDFKSLDVSDLAKCIRRHRHNHAACAVHQPRVIEMAEPDNDATGHCTETSTS